MTLHIHRGSWWTIVCPPYGVFHSIQNGLYHWSSTQPTVGINIYLVLHKVTNGTLATWNLPRVYLIQVTRAEVLT